MNQHQYIDILDKNLIPFTEENLPENWIFQADNEPKHLGMLNDFWRNIMLTSCVGRHNHPI